MKKYLLAFFFFCSALALSAQTAAELDTLLETNAVTAAAAARFILGAADLLPPELSGTEAEEAAYAIALEMGWTAKNADAAVTLQDTAFLVMNAFDIKGGIMYSRFRNPRYAYREMIYRKLIQGRADSAKINLSPGDTKEYRADFTWSDFSNTYFAPRRVVASLYGEFPGFLYEQGHFYAGLLAQFDLSGATERFHTQYLLVRYTFVYKAFDFSLAGAAELENTRGRGFKPAFAASLEGGMQLPTALKDRVSLGIRWASGEGPNTAAFFPVIREAQGIVLKPHFSGVMVLRANYRALFLPSLSAEIGGRYFFRTDSYSFADPDLTGDSYLLGWEIDGSVLWVPYSDLSVSLAGGIFLPQTGTAMRSGAPVLSAGNLPAGV